MCAARYPAMRRTFIAVLMMIAVTLAAVSGPLYVQNNTRYILYLSPGPESSYRQVPPGGLLPAGEAASLDGFAYDRGSFQLATVEIELEVVSDEGFVGIEESDLSSIRTVSAADVAETLSAPRLDNRYLDWLPVSPLFARGRGRLPLGSFVDKGMGREPVSPDDALLWERSGTDLEWMKTARTGDDLFFAASAYSAFTRSSSLSLFVYGSSDVPVATIDVDASAESGLILMWMPRLPEPLVVGNSVAGDFFIEAQIWLDVIVKELSKESSLGPVLLEMMDSGLVAEAAPASSPGPAPVMLEIATASSAAGVWEEFVLARVPFVQILTK